MTDRVADILVDPSMGHPEDDMTLEELELFFVAHPELEGIRFTGYGKSTAAGLCTVTARTRTDPVMYLSGTGKTFREAARNLEQGR